MFPPPYLKERRTQEEFRSWPKSFTGYVLGLKVAKQLVMDLTRRKVLAVERECHVLLLEASAVILPAVRNRPVNHMAEPALLGATKLFCRRCSNPRIDWRIS